MVENLSVTRILQKHEVLKNGTKTIFYSKDAFNEVRSFLDDMFNDENGYVYDYGYDYRPWSDGIHASCFFCWCTQDGTQYFRTFDCYVMN